MVSECEPGEWYTVTTVRPQNIFTTPFHVYHINPCFIMLYPKVLYFLSEKNLLLLQLRLLISIKIIGAYSGPP